MQTIQNDELDENDLMNAVRRFSTMGSAWVFVPDWTSIIMWELGGFLFILYQSVVVPFRLSFEVEAESGFFFWLELLMDVYFLTDIAVQFNKGFYQKGVLVMQR